MPPVTFLCAGPATTPLAARRGGLRSMRRLLPRMQLAGRASAVLHPLIRVLNGPVEELRREVRTLAVPPSLVVI